MMAVFAFACALLIAPPKPARSAEPSEADDEWAQDRAAGVRRPVFPLPQQQPALPPAWPQPAADERPVRERWGKDIEWPEAWQPRRKPGGSRPDEG
jgi:hypothetical protein